MTAIETEAGVQAAGAGAEPGVARAAKLRRDILSRRARVGVVGMGYVGLPLAVSFAEAGYEVLGFEIDAERVAALNRGESHIGDVPSAVVGQLVDESFLAATSDMARLSEVDAISICVPTPLSKTKDPDISAVVAAATAVASALRPGQLVVLESTTYPGTTREVILPTLEEAGLRVGEDFFLAFSPERVDPGNVRYTVKNTPKVVGGIDATSTELATLLYRQAIDTVVAVSSPEAAEMAKLLENTFRAVNIALANETALMCDRLGLDVWEVIDAAATKPFGFMRFTPGPGVGGHCIPLDPFYLSWKMRTLNYRARFIELAGEINTSMPHHVVSKVVDGLNEFEKSVKGADILVLGAAYKPDIADARESPALDIIALLRERGADVSYSDPHLPTLAIGDVTLASDDPTPERLAAADCVVIVTAHAAFDFGRVAQHATLVVDTRNALSGALGATRVLSL